MDFDETVASLRTAISETGLDIPSRLAAEATVESLHDWSELGDLKEARSWFLTQRSANTMTVQRIPVADCRGWFVEDSTGYLRHESGEFFVVETIDVSLSASREVGAGGWCQPIVTQVGDDGGILGLPRKRVSGAPHYLVQAKAEPGNYEIVSLSPAVQATFSNLKRAHGGSLPRFAEYFYPEVPARCTVIADRWLAEDGGRLFNKRNRGVIIELPAEENLELPEDFRWMSMWQIKALMAEDAWVNPHLFRLISMVGNG